MTNQTEQLTFRKYIENQLNDFIERVFESSVNGGNFRRWLFIFSGAVVWAVGSAILTPVDVNDTIFSYPFRALFAPQISRHLLIAISAFYYALKLAAKYLADVFELNDESIAMKYILQASLADIFDVITISEGKVSNRESTIVKIGGPGLVKVNLDSAALFEKADGSPTVVGPQHGLVALDRFERLRRVISLREHVVETNVHARTRDGIPISAEGIKIRYHVNRDNQQSTLEKPYPYVSHAVSKIIYGEMVENHIHPNYPEDTAELPHKNKHPEFMEIKANSIEEKLNNFISQHSLSEFLARISEHEINDLNEQTQTVEMEAKKLSGEEYSQEETYELPEAGTFFSRDQITESLYEVNNYMERINTGIQMDWIDIGTWELPPHAQSIPKQHLEAWKQSLENLQKRSADYQRQIQIKSSTSAIRNILKEILYSLTIEVGKGNAIDSSKIEAGLRIYRQKLYLAQELYRKQGLATPILLASILQHLDSTLKESHTN